MANEDQKADRVRKPINVRGKVRVIKVPPSPVEQYIILQPDERRYMLDLPEGSTITRITPEEISRLTVKTRS